MSRDLPSALATLSTAASFPPVFFVELDWPDGTVRVWNGYGNYIWGGNTWQGTGHLGEIGNISESSDLKANGVALKLSGIPSGEIASALADNAQGVAARIYFGALDGAGSLVSDPYLVFDGLVDFTVIDDDGKSASITVQLEKELIASNTQPRRYTEEDQKIDDDTDEFFSLLAGNVGKNFTWGKKPSFASGYDGYGNSDDMEYLS